ncbi:MAG TPA: HAMP domain-containing sensor histidine kinase [Chloroflexia bacterium]|nr:HAMP domain-containing sensor histidine kinase [Chloroflexia bacterium]
METQDANFPDRFVTPGNDSDKVSNWRPGGTSSDEATPLSGMRHLITRVLELADAPGANSDALRELLIEAGDLFAADAASLYLYNVKHELKYTASFGLSNRTIRQVEEMAQAGTANHLLSTQDAPTSIEDIREPSGDGASTDVFLEMLARKGVVSLAAFPLMARDNLLGFLTLYHNSRRVYGKEEVDDLSVLARVLAMALLNIQLNEARKMEDKGRDHFVSALSHELRTPLTSIIGFTQVIRRKLASAPAADGRMAEHMDVIWAQAQRLNRLIDTFVDIANIEQGDFSIKFSKVELVSVLRSALEQTVTRLNSTNQIEITVPDHLIWVPGDRQRLEQVFSHVISNALRYSPSEASVGLRCIERASHGDVEVSVTDKGPGISDNLRDAIFERFYRAEALRSGGLGVGLYLSKTIVEAHGGQIVVESEPGEGTTVSIILPA